MIWQTANEREEDSAGDAAARSASQQHTGRLVRQRDGAVVTLNNGLRWWSDSFEIAAGAASAWRWPAGSIAATEIELRGDQRFELRGDQRFDSRANSCATRFGRADRMGLRARRSQPPYPIEVALGQRPAVHREIDADLRAQLDHDDILLANLTVGWRMKL